jgi:hypothetical protein
LFFRWTCFRYLKCKLKLFSIICKILEIIRFSGWVFLTPQFFDELQSLLIERWSFIWTWWLLFEDFCYLRLACLMFWRLALLLLLNLKTLVFLNFRYFVLIICSDVLHQLYQSNWLQYSLLEMCQESTIQNQLWVCCCSPASWDPTF